MRIFAFAVAALAAGALVLGTTEVKAQDTKLTVGLTSDFPSVDPLMDLSPIGFNLRLNIYDQLTEIRKDGSVGTRLAKSWQSSPDAKTWTFELRTDAKFHDGSPVTVDDVIWTVKKALGDSRSPLKVYLAKVQSVERVGDTQVRFNLSEPFAIFDRQLSFVSVLPQKAYEAMGEAEFAQKPIGSGPYKLIRRIKDDRTELAAFDQYWRGAPKIKSVILRPIPSPFARNSALLTGEIDIDPSVPPSLIPKLQSNPDVKVTQADGFRVMYIGFNVNFAPALADPNFRLAVDAAIDREGLGTKLLRGLGRPTGQLPAKVVFGHDPSIPVTPFDPKKAKELLAKTVYKGETIPLQYPNNNYALADDVAQAISGYLKNVGINVELKPMEFSAFLPAWAQRKMDGMFYFAFGPAVFDADNITSGMYETGSRIYAVDPEIDRLARQARAESDQSKRKQLFSQIFKISNATAAYVPLYEEVLSFATRADVTWEPIADGYFRFYQMEPPKRK
jgi:peptide/nickel transport system substrate-binding protein